MCKKIKDRGVKKRPFFKTYSLKYFSKILEVKYHMLRTSTSSGQFSGHRWMVDFCGLGQMMPLQSGL